MLPSSQHFGGRRTKNKRSRLDRLAPERKGTSKISSPKLYNERRREEERLRKRDLAELECGQEELKLEREEMAKMAQTFKESTFKNSPTTCMGEIITTMQKMAITHNKVNKNLVKTITGIVRSSLEKPR
jgi:hypothetical protein